MTHADHPSEGYISTSDTKDETYAGSTEAADARSRGKRQLRAVCLRLREELGQPYRDWASQCICEHIREWSTFQSARVIFAYLPMRGEVDLRPLIGESSTVRWAIPRVVDMGDRHLVFHAYQPNRLVRHRYGMQEPHPAAPVISPAQADLIIVPGMAFTRSGYRLGYGGGYYDRYLGRREHVSTLGVCFHALLRDEVPHEEHDVPVDNLVTESMAVISCREAR